MNKKYKPNNAVIFLLIVIIIYLIVFLINPSYTKSSFSNFLEAMLNILPIVGFVFIILFIVNYFLKPEKVKKHLGHESGLKGWFYIFFTGGFIPMGPPYVVLPLLGELKKQGMREALIISFLYVRNLQLIFLIVMAYYFGIIFTLVVSFYVFIFAILSGVLVEKIVIK